MKKRISILSLILSLMLVFTACTGPTALPDSSTDSSPVPEFQTAAAEPEVSMSTLTPMVSKTTAGSLSFKGFTTGNIPGDIKNVYNGGGSNVLVTTSNTLYLYDLSQDAVTAKTETGTSSRTYREEHYKPVRNGFVGLLLDLNRPGSESGLLEGSSVPDVTCIFYDLQLNKIREIKVLEVLAGVMSEADKSFGVQELRIIDVSDDGSRIAAGSLSALYLYDIETGTARQIVPESKNMIPNDVRFAGNSRVAFGGAYLPAGASESTYSYGTVNIDGSNLQIHTPENFRAGELPGVRDSFVLVGQDMRAVSGQLLIHPADGAARTIKLATAREGDMAYLSDGGKYFATSVNGDKLAVRIYEMESGSLVTEAFIAEDDVTLISRVPDVRILDSLRTAIIIYGQHVNTRIKVVQF